MEGGEEVWTTDKEARGRAERKPRCMNIVMERRERHRYTSILWVMWPLHSPSADGCYDAGIYL